MDAADERSPARSGTARDIGLQATVARAVQTRGGARRVAGMPDAAGRITLFCCVGTERVSIGAADATERGVIGLAATVATQPLRRVSVE
jgi:hypothetical protein